MKRLLSLLLALALSLALAAPAGAAELPAETGGVTLEALQAELETAAAEARAETIRALGGVSGQVNVLLNDGCISFSDAIPAVKNGRTMVPMRAAVEAMGASVSYDRATRTASVKMGDISFTHVIGTDVITLSDGTAVKMDTVSLIDSGRTMVPLRFFSQVLGYDVFWDHDYKMAFLMDRERWVADIDSALTIFNGALARQRQSLDRSGPLQSTLDFTGTLTLPGSGSYPFSAGMTALTDGSTANYSAKLDIAALLTLLTSLSGETLPEQTRSLLSSSGMDIIVSEKGRFVKSPLIDKAYGTQGGWLQTGTPEEAAASAAALSSDAATLGGALYTMAQLGDHNHFFSVWSMMNTSAALALVLFNDEMFAASGDGGFQWNLSALSLAQLIAAFTGEPCTLADLQASGLRAFLAGMRIHADGSITASFVLELDGETPGEINFVMTGTGRSSILQGTIDLQDAGSLSFRFSVETKAAGSAPRTAPAASELIGSK